MEYLCSYIFLTVTLNVSDISIQTCLGWTVK